ncbi:hypothetical protein CspeluHIS016_0305010 [Cutaneotrichosporon spelunceum]|uniref:C3H1-type domain-containing protein n=1 Tax=Cutaneotrichosporon spelunceum TaxID=1672016 RepID=A0AAD3YB53_9TREE|nr:hypothetical protein CspeluHIS016_0305010 [Cutaneotrichosporon spelunceum]
MSGPLFSGFRVPTSFSAHRASRDAPESMEPYRIPQYRPPWAPPPTPTTGTTGKARPARLALSSKAVAPAPLTAPVRSRMAGQAAGRGISIDVGLGRGEKGPTTGRRWPASPGRTPTSAGFPRARGLTVALLTGGGELYAESAPVTPSVAGLTVASPAVPALELGSSPGLPAPATTPVTTPRQEKILCRFYHTAGMTCTSSPCRFVHKIEVPPGPATASLSAVPLLSPETHTPDPTSGTFAAAQASALAQAQPAFLQIDGTVQITPGEAVALQTEAGAELGFVYKMSGGGKGPAGKSRLKYRTVPCKDFATGMCAYGDEYCSFIHDPENRYDEAKHGKKEQHTPSSKPKKLWRKAEASPPADAILTPPLGHDVVVSYSALPAPRLAPAPRGRPPPEARFVSDPAPAPAEWEAPAPAPAQETALQVHTNIPPTLDEDYPLNMSHPRSPGRHGVWVPSPDEYLPFFPLPNYDGYEPAAPLNPSLVWGVPQDAAPRSVFPLVSPDEIWGYGLGSSLGRQYWRTRPCQFWVSSGGRTCPHGETCRFQHVLPRRRRPASPQSPHANAKNVKTVPCRFFNSAEGCTRSDAQCPFVHVRVLPEGQHLPKPVPYRTRPCRHFQAGRCAMGSACHFAHVTDPTAVQGSPAPPPTPVTPSKPFLVDMGRRIAVSRAGGAAGGVDDGEGDGWERDQPGENRENQEGVEEGEGAGGEGEKERSNSAPAASAHYATLVAVVFACPWQETGQCTGCDVHEAHEARGLTESALAAACEVLRAKASAQSSAVESDDDDDDGLEIVTAPSRPSTRSSRSV